MDRRIVFLDYVRVIACFMVIVVHVAECYYCTAEGVVLASDSDRLWVSLIDGLFRPAVPLFVMVSSYLLLPLPYSTSVFVIMKHLSCTSSAVYGPVRKISGLSYGIYLMHIFMLSFIFGQIGGLLPTPVSIFTVAAATYLSCIAITWLLSRFPGHKYIIG